MKLSDWARQIGFNYRTAWRWVRDDKLPKGVVAYRTKSGTIIINVSAEPKEEVPAIFIMESEDDTNVTDRQNAIANWYKTTIKDSRFFTLAGTPSKLTRLIGTVKHETIIVETGVVADPFALELLQAAMEASGRKLLVFPDPASTLRKKTAG